LVTVSGSQAVQPRVAVRLIRRAQLAAGADPSQRASVFELLKQLKVEVAGDPE
jgi:hypothetical protein